VVVWRNRNGKALLNDFTYKNIIGRGGRMFRHFIGKIYILEKPPQEEAAQLRLEFPDQILGDVDETVFDQHLREEQKAAIIAFRREMSRLVGSDVLKRLLEENAFQTSDFELIQAIAEDMRYHESEWNGLSYLNSDYVGDWDRLLYKILRLWPGAWETRYTTFVEFVKALACNWSLSISELLSKLDEYDVGIEDFFKYERTASYKLAALVSDVNVLYEAVLGDGTVDVSPFVGKLSHAFLPPVVYQLEEYGLPRMITKKIHNRGIIDFEDDRLTIHEALNILGRLGEAKVIEEVGLHRFERYIVRYFYDGIKRKDG
jgi:hypothetical protein